MSSLIAERLPRDGQASRGWRRATGVRRTRVPRLPDLRGAGARLRAPALYRLRAGAARAVFLQGPGLLSELRRPAHDRGRRASGRRGAAARARAPGGAEPALPPSLSPGLGSRVGPRGARRGRPRAPQLSAPPRAPIRHPRRAVGMRDRHPTPLPPPTDDEVGIVLARITARVQQLLQRRGLDPGQADEAQADPVVEESRSSRASTCTPTSPCRRRIARAWNSSAVICSGQQ